MIAHYIILFQRGNKLVIAPLRSPFCIFLQPDWKSAYIWAEKKIPRIWAEIKICSRIILQTAYRTTYFFWISNLFFSENDENQPPAVSSTSHSAFADSRYQGIEGFGEIGTQNSSSVAVGEPLDRELIKKYQKEGEYVYELYSIMMHQGNAAGGHYFAYIKLVICFLKLAQASRPLQIRSSSMWRKVSVKEPQK